MELGCCGFFVVGSPSSGIDLCFSGFCCSGYWKTCVFFWVIYFVLFVLFLVVSCRLSGSVFIVGIFFVGCSFLGLDGRFCVFVFFFGRFF